MILLSNLITNSVDVVYLTISSFLNDYCVEVFYNPEKSSLFAACDIFPQQAEKSFLKLIRIKTCMTELVTHKFYLFKMISVQMFNRFNG